MSVIFSGFIVLKEFHSNHPRLDKWWSMTSFSANEPPSISLPNNRNDYIELRLNQSTVVELTVTGSDVSQVWIETNIPMMDYTFGEH